ncbi:MAG: hypothetical protein ACJAWF_001156 [Candidatus Azotimanducaceae bacterium]|jgi:hypothetical protein
MASVSSAGSSSSQALSLSCSSSVGKNTGGIRYGYTFIAYRFGIDITVANANVSDELNSTVTSA